MSLDGAKYTTPVGAKQARKVKNRFRETGGDNLARLKRHLARLKRHLARLKRHLARLKGLSREIEAISPFSNLAGFVLTLVSPLFYGGETPFRTEKSPFRFGGREIGSILSPFFREVGLLPPKHSAAGKTTSATADSSKRFGGFFRAQDKNKQKGMQEMIKAGENWWQCRACRAFEAGFYVGVVLGAFLTMGVYAIAKAVA